MARTAEYQARAFLQGGSRFMVVVFAALLVSAACGGGESNAPSITTVRIGSATIHADLALTVAQKSVGLSGRDSLDRDAGLLFVYSAPQRATFWMKDMRFPLDFVWISGDKRVVKLTEDVTPSDPEEPDVPLYFSGREVGYVLEVNAGAASELGISVGDEVTFEPEVDTTRAE